MFAYSFSLAHLRAYEKWGQGSFARFFAQVGTAGLGSVNIAKAAMEAIVVL